MEVAVLKQNVNNLLITLFPTINLVGNFIFIFLYKKKYKVGWSLAYAPCGEPVSAINHLHNKDRYNLLIDQIKSDIFSWSYQQ